EKQALHIIGGWFRILFVLTACAVALAGWGFSTARLVPGIAGVVLALIGVALTFVVHLCMVRGKQNVEKILNSLEQ
ncbi:MAG: hypothetical protein ACI4OI_01445, partial [Gemmiger sp.]